MLSARPEPVNRRPGPTAGIARHDHSPLRLPVPLGPLAEPGRPARHARAGPPQNESGTPADLGVSRDARAINVKQLRRVSAALALEATDAILPAMPAV